MDVSTICATKPLVGEYYVQAVYAFEQKHKEINKLFQNKKVPEEGWNEKNIEELLHSLSMMDSNNFIHNSGVGEREARFASNIVARRHFWMGHGIGRSGDISENQPKAVGSSLLNKLTNEFALDMVKSLGAPGTQKCLVVPMATGMSLVLCLRALHSKRPDAKYVIWSRIDQKSCIKCIFTAGLVPVVVDCEIADDYLVTDVKALYQAILKAGATNIVCILTTTSCFAPRAPDNVEAIANFCVEFDIPHLINNAYGLQSKSSMEHIEKASKIRVDMYVSSTDKNFMVPVGGSIIAGFDPDKIDYVGKMYPGRASATPTMDLFITLLNIGKKGYRCLLDERKIMFIHLLSQLKSVAAEFGEKVIEVNDNEMSLALTLQGFKEVGDCLLTEIGSMLFSKQISGSRVVSIGERKTIGNIEFFNWGSHSCKYKVCYLTAAATVGITKQDIDTFILKLSHVLFRVRKHGVQIATADVAVVS